MERKKHDKRKRLDIHCKKKQKNRKSDTERRCMNYQSQRIRCSVYSNYRKKYRLKVEEKGDRQTASDNKIITSGIEKQ